jgi:CRP/FNR family transcriptional regulator
MTQQEMAHHLGTTRECIARIMQAFVKRNLVETQRGSTRIIDAKGLSGDPLANRATPLVQAT